MIHIDIHDNYCSYIDKDCLNERTIDKIKLILVNNSLKFDVDDLYIIVYNLNYETLLELSMNYLIVIE